MSHAGDPGVDAVPLVAVVGSPAAERDLVLVAVLQLAEVVAAVAVAVRGRRGRDDDGGGVLREGGDGAVHLGGGVEVVLVVPVVDGPVREHGRLLVGLVRLADVVGGEVVVQVEVVVVGVVDLVVAPGG